jgi:hypothetical protein
LRAAAAPFITLTNPRYEFCPCPAEMALDRMVLFVLRPMWIIFVPVSACWWWLVSATE